MTRIMVKPRFDGMEFMCFYNDLKLIYNYNGFVIKF